MGNKYEILDQLLSLFPSNVNTFYDLFGGSGCVSGNVQANKVVYNELNNNIVQLYKLFVDYDADYINNYILSCIEKYGLNTEGTDVRQNVPNIREVREQYNQRYLKFRDAYNKSERDYLMLYVLTYYSFSNLIRFNSDSEFNMPYGNRCCRYTPLRCWHFLYLDLHNSLSGNRHSNYYLCTTLLNAHLLSLYS